jgi:Mce-associated membrane protein
MTDEPKVGADDTDTEQTAMPSDGAAARRPSPSAQAASRARRIGGRSSPGPRPAPSRPATDAQTGGRPSPTNKAAAGTKRAKAAAESSADSASTARRGGLRAARAAATERAVEAERPTTSLRKRPSPTKVIAPASKSGVGAGHRRLDLIRWIPAGVLGVAVVVLAALCYSYGNGVWHGTQSVSEVRGQVLAAAKTCTAKVSSYDYRKLAQAKKDGQACATGKFKQDYTTAMDTIIAKEAPTTQTAQSVQVAKAGIEQVSSDGKQWTLLIYGQHTVTNKTTGTKTPRLDKLSVRVTMDKVGKKWLISKIDLVDG